MPPPIDADLVTRLVAEQFPRWVDLPVAPVPRDGWDNRSFRLGDDLVVRLPSAQGYVPQVAKEARWLPWLAPQLPRPIPEPVGLGRPGAGYPWPWSVRTWLPGPTADDPAVRLDQRGLAGDLAGFLVALQRIDPTNGPAAGAHSAHRGLPPAVWDAQTRAAITALGGSIDGRAATRVWQRALAAPTATAPVWLHGDVAGGNLLVDAAGRLAAVIDFGCAAVGDPACDLTVAWTLLDETGRVEFRSALPVDAATWDRAAGWALWKAVISMADPDHAPAAHRAASAVVLDRVLADGG